jgi:RNA polymerase sigma factor (sigma-70 family)
MMRGSKVWNYMGFRHISNGLYRDDATDPSEFLNALSTNNVTFELDERWEREQTEEKLQQALLQLTRRERWVLTEHYYGGRTKRDIAGDLGLRNDQVRALIKGALAKLRDILEDKLNDNRWTTTCN